MNKFRGLLAGSTQTGLTAERVMSTLVFIVMVHLSGILWHRASLNVGRMWAVEGGQSGRVRVERD